MTTAPVTTGGRILWMTVEPRKWIAAPTSAKTSPPMRIAPVTVLESAPGWARIAAATPTNEADVPR